MVSARGVGSAATAVPRGVKALTLLPGSGYGDAGALYVRGLHRRGIPVSWTPIAPAPGARHPRHGIEPHEGREVEEAVAADCGPELLGLRDREVDAEVLFVNLPQGWWGAALQRYPGARAAVSTAWETDRLPRGWADELNRADLVLVPSGFNRRVFVESGVRVPVEVVPHGARPVAPVPGGSFGAVAPGDFVFYTIAEWRARKALPELVRTYLETFSADEPVALVIKTSDLDHDAVREVGQRLVSDPPAPYIRSWWTLAHIVAEYPRPAKIHLIAGRGPERSIDQLHTRGDCFVSLSHGEGWGLGAFDAALHGKPSIVTGWGGQLDYLGDDYPLLVDYRLGRVVERGSSGRVLAEMPDQRWAIPDREHAGALMRWAFGNRRRLGELGEALGRRTRERFERDRVCERLARVLGL